MRKERVSREQEEGKNGQGERGRNKACDLHCTYLLIRVRYLVAVVLVWI